MGFIYHETDISKAIVIYIWCPTDINSTFGIVKGRKEDISSRVSMR